MKIRNRINFGYLSAYIIIMSLVGLVIGIYTTGLVRKNIDAYIQSSNHARAEHIRTYIRDQKITSEILAAASVYRDFLKTPASSSEYAAVKKKIDDRFIRTRQVDPTIDEVFIIDRYGKIAASSDKTQEGLDKSHDDYFAKAQSSTHIKDVYYSDTVNKFNYTISTPIIDDNGMLLGVSVMRYLSKNFFSITQAENRLGDTEENFLINKDKFFLTPSKFFGEAAILKEQAVTKNADACFNQQDIAYVTKNGYAGLIDDRGSQIVEAKDYRNVDVIATHAYIPETGWCLITKVDKSDVLSFRFWIIIIMTSIFLFAAALFLIIGSYISRRLTKPIQALSLAAKKIEQGDLNYKTNITSSDEIGSLSKAFDKMIVAVRESRSDIEKKVREQTKSLIIKTGDLEKQKEAMLNVLEDVEAEKRLSDSLAQDLEKFRLAVSDASDHIIITDGEGITLFANKGVELITGFKAEEVLGKKAGAKDLWGGLMSRDFYEQMWRRLKVEKKTFSGQIENKRKNGERYFAQATITPILGKDGKVNFFVAIERDVSKEVQIDRAKTEFVSLASHQLRTPLSAINWYSEMLLAGDAGKLNETQEQYIKEVYAGNQRMVDLVNALLNISRIDLGTFAIDPEPTDFCKLAVSVLAEVQPMVKAKKMDVKNECEKDLPLVNADPKLVRIIFQNLLTNALKYTPEKGEVAVIVAKQGKDILIKVTDNGYGIPEAQKNKIFTKLFRADNVREHDAEGTGLGLYMVKAIVEQSGGKIWFESEENKGTTFFVTLPLTGMKKKEGSKELASIK